jgi:hypothetical protein
MGVVCQEKWTTRYGSSYVRAQARHQAWEDKSKASQEETSLKLKTENILPRGAPSKRFRYGGQNKPLVSFRLLVFVMLHKGKTLKNKEFRTIRGGLIRKEGFNGSVKTKISGLIEGSIFEHFHLLPYLVFLSPAGLSRAYASWPSRCLGGRPR